jgi:hypothetical protein
MSQGHPALLSKLKVTEFFKTLTQRWLSRIIYLTTSQSYGMTKRQYPAQHQRVKRLPVAALQRKPEIGQKKRRDNSLESSALLLPLKITDT